MTINLDALEQLARAATPGPWHAVQGVKPNERAVTNRNGAWFAELCDGSTRANDADAAFIAAANPAAVIELVQRLRAAEGIVRDLAMSPTYVGGSVPDAASRLEQLKRRAVEATRP
jgi:hypothetical protein